MAKINTRDRNKNTGRKANWEYRFEVASINGKRQWVSESGYRTKKEAQEAGAKALAEYYQCGIHFTPSDISVSDFLDYWLENYCKVHYKETTIQNRTYIVNKNIKPYIGRYKLSTITPTVLQKFINGFKDFSKSYITGTLATIHSAFQCAVYPFKFLKENPALHVIPPKSTTLIIHKEKETITKQEFKSIIAKYPFGSNYYIPIMLGYHCGLRISETLGLTWDAVDFSEKNVKINMQMNQLANNGNPVRKMSYPKYGSSRIIPFDNELYEALIKEYDRQLELRRKLGDYYATYQLDSNAVIVDGGDTLNIVCRNKYGRLLSFKSLRYTLERISKLLNKQVSYHTFRHSHATMLLDCGVNPKVIQQRLGHKQISTTLNVYTHATDEAQRSAVKKLQNYYQDND